MLTIAARTASSSTSSRPRPGSTVRRGCAANALTHRRVELDLLPAPSRCIEAACSHPHGLRQRAPSSGRPADRVRVVAVRCRAAGCDRRAPRSFAVCAAGHVRCSPLALHRSTDRRSPLELDARPLSSPTPLHSSMPPARRAVCGARRSPRRTAPAAGTAWAQYGAHVARSRLTGNARCDAPVQCPQSIRRSP